MKNWDKEVEHSLLKDEKAVIRNLGRCYQSALKEIDDKIGNFAARISAGDNVQSAVYQMKYQQELKKQVESAIKNLQGNNYSTISEYLQSTYRNGFVGAQYSLHKQGIPMITPINQQSVVQAITLNSKISDGLYSRLGVDVERFKRIITAEVSRGIATGSSWNQIAKQISDKGNVVYSNASRIARTEGHRIQSEAKMDAYTSAKEKGADIVKQWDSTLDGTTRDTHRRLDGQIRELDEDFEIDGMTASAPGLFGDPAEDCNCRCCLLQRARWALDKDELETLQERAEYFGLDKTKDFDDFKEKYLKAVENSGESGIIEDKEVIQILDKLKDSGMSESEYNEYLNILNAHNNTDIVRLYNGHADEIADVKLSSGGGAYQPSTNSLTFNYPQYSDMSKYGTLAHEYGHFFDTQVKYDGLHFKEISAVQNATGLNAVFRGVASSSDEFLAAIRKDKEHIRSILTSESKADLAVHNASHGVQDAIDGLFSKSRIRWGHGERYYNRKYAAVEYIDKMSSSSSRKKALQQVYKDLGFDASSQAKTKMICRQYEAASEAWANIMSAEVCGGESLEYVKQYLPNSYKAMLDILKGAK